VGAISAAPARGGIAPPRHPGSHRVGAAGGMCEGLPQMFQRACQFIEHQLFHKVGI
jgi:hypothetical protein